MNNGDVVDAVVSASMQCTECGAVVSVTSDRLEPDEPLTCDEHTGPDA